MKSLPLISTTLIVIEIKCITFGITFLSKPSRKPLSISIFYGLDGSRTRVQKPIPCPSTIIVNYCGLLPFPPMTGN